MEKRKRTRKWYEGPVPMTTEQQKEETRNASLKLTALLVKQQQMADMDAFFRKCDPYLSSAARIDLS